MPTCILGVLFDYITLTAPSAWLWHAWPWYHFQINDNYLWRILTWVPFQKVGLCLKSLRTTGLESSERADCWSYLYAHSPWAVVVEYSTTSSTQVGGAMEDSFPRASRNLELHGLLLHGNCTICGCMPSVFSTIFISSCINVYLSTRYMHTCLLHVSHSSPLLVLVELTYGGRQGAWVSESITVSWQCTCTVKGVKRSSTGRRKNLTIGSKTRKGRMLCAGKRVW